MEENIKVIYEEALRKYNGIREVVDSHDRKAATLLGFIGVLVGIFLASNFSLIEIVSKNNYYAVFSLILGLFFSLLSFFFSCINFWTKKIYTGAKVRGLITLYNEQPNKNLLKVVIAKFVKAEREVSNISNIKVCK
jgi:vacuolar-type H+-ATPase subunit I/STV1